MTATQLETMDRAFEAICTLLMPFFLIGAGDDPEKARCAVSNLLRAYDALPQDAPQKISLAEQITVLRKWDQRWAADSIATNSPNGAAVCDARSRSEVMMTLARAVDYPQHSRR